MKRTILPILVVAFLVTTACGFTIPRAAAPEAEVTDRVEVSAPPSDSTRLTLSFGAGDLTLSPGAESDLLVQGTATYNYTQLKPMITTDGGNVHVQTGDGSFKSFPSSDSIINRWNLKLGSSPMDLTIESGAYTGTVELGGLALTGLTVKDGAATVDLSFSKPNLAEMAILRYETGASTVTLNGLANANFGTLIFKSGAGNYTLDFSGKLQRDASVSIEGGLSNFILVIPDGVHAVVTMEGGASNVHTGPGWSQAGNIYTQDGEGPTLTILIKTGATDVTITR
jgi:hypothetical protein